MKIRSCFVSNSSSSSFIIHIKDLTEDQIKKIKKNNQDIQKGNSPGAVIPTPCWDIEILTEVILGKTCMNNYDYCGFLESIGVDMDKVEWHD